MTPAVIVLAVMQALCVVLILNLNRHAEHLENLVVDAANDLRDNGRVGDMTGAKILSAARSISE